VGFLFKVIILRTLNYTVLIPHWRAMRLLLPVIPLAAQVAGLVGVKIAPPPRIDRRG